MSNHPRNFHLIVNSSFHLIGCTCSFPAVIVGVIAVAGLQSKHIFTSVSPVAKKQLLTAFEDVWKSDDVAAVHYAVGTYRVFNERLPVTDEVRFELLDSYLISSDYFPLLVVNRYRFSCQLGTDNLYSDQESIGQRYHIRVPISCSGSHETYPSMLV